MRGFYLDLLWFVEAIDDGMSFSPWHGVTAFQPLAIMRVRREVYKSPADFRGTFTLYNGCPMHAPRAAPPNA